MPLKSALDHVAGYCVANDVSEREFLLERGSQWDKSKGCDTFGPLGPWLVTRDEVPNPQKLAMWLDLNGKRMQTGNTRTMIFSVVRIISHLSQYMTLMPGYVVSTGTPPGVGLGMRPQRFLQKGDVMTRWVSKGWARSASGWCYSGGKPCDPALTSNGLLPAPWTAT